MPATANEYDSLLAQVSHDLRGLIHDEVALAKAELKPAVKHVGLGSGLFAGAGYFAFSATLILWFIFAAGFAWLYEATTGLSTWGCGFFGVLTAFVLVLIIAVILALLGRNSFRKVHGPSKTPVTIEQAIDSIESGIRQGSAAVKRRYGRRAKDRADETAING